MVPARGRKSILLVRLLGIPIRLDYSWFIVFAMLTWLLAAEYYPAAFADWPAALYWVTGAATAMLFFASLLLHELGHSVVALRYKMPVRGITLFVFGGVAQIGVEPPSAIAEFLIALAGPLVSFALALSLFVLQPLLGGVPVLLGIARYLAYMNLAVALFNLIPGYPLDGGRVLRAVVWAVTGDASRATVAAARVGRGFAFLFIAVGMWQALNGDLAGGLWIAFIGWFLDGAARTQLVQVMLQRLLAGHTVAQAMSAAAEQAAPALEEAKVVSPETGLFAALQSMDREGVDRLPVVAAGRQIGTLSREDVIAYLRSSSPIA